ncbi:MAG: hypothetical protein ACREEE_09520 [Dongiaceae bacterium]
MTLTISERKDMGPACKRARAPSCGWQRAWPIVIVLALAAFTPADVEGSHDKLQVCGRNDYKKRVEELIAEKLGGTAVVSAIVHTLPIGPEWGVDILRPLEGPELVLTEFNDSLIAENVRIFGPKSPDESFAKTAVNTVVRRRAISIELADKLQALWGKATSAPQPFGWICIQCMIYRFKTVEGGCAEAANTEPGSVSNRLVTIIDDLRELARAEDASSAAEQDAAILKAADKLIQNFH